MNSNETNILNDEIHKRITSNKWNFEIANRVLNSRKKSRKRVAFVSYISSFSLAALAVIFYFMASENKKQETVYQKFITKQVEGTDHYIKNNKSLNSFTVYDLTEPDGNDMDYFVDEILRMRY